MPARNVDVPPPTDPEADWVPVQPFPPLEGHRSFVSSDAQQGRLRVAYFRRSGDVPLVAKVWFGRGAEGPPGRAHGGSVAAVLDEAMGAAAWLDGHPAVAARLAVDFRQAVPLGTDATLEAWVERVEGRKITTRARLLGPAGEPFADAEGLYVELAPEQLRELIERRT